MEKEKEAVRKQYAGTALWMKAPNGEATNLTEDQWLTVRTPAVKAWFGDWEAEAEKQKYLHTEPIEVAEKQIVKSEGVTAMEAAFQWAEQHLPVQVSTRFGTVEINRASIKDSLGHRFSQKKLDAITSLPDGMKVAAFIGEAQDFGGADLYNGYFCYPMMYQGERQVVFCRVRRDMNSNKLYVHEVFTEDEIKDNSFQTVAQSLNSKPHGGNVLYKSILTDFLNKDNTVSYVHEVFTEDEIKDIPLQTAAKFLNSKPHGGNVLYKSILTDFLNKDNAVSKVVDENGEPLVVYHATLAEFTKFRPSESGLYGRGIYLTADKEDTSYTLKDKDWRVMELFANIRNPRDPEAMATREDIEATKKEALNFFEKHPFDKDGTPASFVVNHLLFRGMQPGKVKKSKLTQVLQDAFARKGVAYQESDKHDGAIIRRDGATWYTADQPNQVKSATGNTGAFSAADEDVYHQSKEIVSRAEERLREDEKRWNALIDRYDAADKVKWKKEKDGEMFPFMDVPLVMMLLDVSFDQVQAYGSFFAHSVNKDHPGMTLDLLRQLPRKMTDPLMVTRGNKPDSYVFVVDLKDSNGATVVVPIAINKRLATNHATVNIVNSAFGKTRGKNNNIPSLNWFAKQLDEGTVIYVNKKESAAWMQSYGNDFPAATALNRAFSKFIVSRKFQNVKTETDLEAARRSSFGVYQRARNADQGQIFKDSAGRRVIELFEGADASTFLHEMGHMFLMDLEDLARLSTRRAPKTLKR